MTSSVEFPVIFYDGGCGLCHRGVDFVLRRDPGGRFRYAPLGSPAFVRLIPGEKRAALPDSVVIFTPDGELFVKSRGVRFVLRELGGFWRLPAALLACIPRPLADFGYDTLARIRSRLFTKPKTACPMMPPALRGRFLMD